MKIKSFSDVGILLLGAGVLIFALTFLHLYLTKIYPENRTPLSVSCSGINGTTVMIFANTDLKNVIVEALPERETCDLGDMNKRTSDICQFNETARFVRVKYKGGIFAQECYYPQPVKV